MQKKLNIQVNHQVNMSPPLIHATQLSKSFQTRKGSFQAVTNLSFSLFPGEIFGLAGESGCGKSTVGKLLLRLIDPTQGTIFFKGQELGKLSSEELKHKRKEMQMIFQNPGSSLNPRMTVEEILKEPFHIHRLASSTTREAIEHLLNEVGLSSSYLNRLPHELSGGQKQRIGIARALALRPDFIVCDEPLSALDISTQAQVINLLKRLHEKFHLSYLFISHDLAVMRYLAHRIAIMYLGQFVELAPSHELYQRPRHPYTQSLLSAILEPNPQVEKSRHRVFLKGEMPSGLHPPSGCRFHSRCPFAQPLCKQVSPTWQEVSPGHFVACHYEFANK